MSAHVLNLKERQLVPQLLGRLSKEEGRRTARLLDSAWHQIPLGVLVPRSGKHLLPPGPLLRTLQGHSDWVSGAVILADGRRALSWSRDGTLRLWDLEGGASRALEGHSSWIWGAAVLADGRHTLSWSADRTLRLWDLEGGAGRALVGHSNTIWGAAVLADGRRALSWSGDRTLRLWDINSLKELACFAGDDPLTCCVVSDDDRLAIAGDSRGRVLRFDLAA